MAPTLTHPKTDRSVTISDKEAAFYVDKGWLEVKVPETDAAAAEKAATEAAEKEAREAEAKATAEAEAKAAEDAAKTQKESADGAEAGTGKPAARKAAKAD